MASLAETQVRLYRALLTGDGRSMAPLLVGVHRSRARFAIHMRNYEASLVAALTGKFPACAWLVGERFIAQAAREFVHRQPPTAPCIAEYGADFPRSLADLPAACATPYVASFAELEWHLGHVSIAIDQPPLTMAALAHESGEALADVTLTLQPGLAYLQSPWPVDELMNVYLSDSEPDEYVLEPGKVHLEVAGARGAFRFNRLVRTEFIFRQELRRRASIGVAAEQALAADPAFDPGRALTRLFCAGLVIATV